MIRVKGEQLTCHSLDERGHFERQDVNTETLLASDVSFGGGGVGGVSRFRETITAKVKEGNATPSKTPPASSQSDLSLLFNLLNSPFGTYL